MPRSRGSRITAHRSSVDGSTLRNGFTALADAIDRHAGIDFRVDERSRTDHRADRCRSLRSPTRAASRRAWTTSIASWVLPPRTSLGAARRRQQRGEVEVATVDLQLDRRVSSSRRVDRQRAGCTAAEDRRLKRTRRRACRREARSAGVHRRRVDRPKAQVARSSPRHRHRAREARRAARRRRRTRSGKDPLARPSWLRYRGCPAAGSSGRSSTASGRRSQIDG